MKAAFVETTEFTEWVSDYLPDEAYAAVQQALLSNPNKGVVMQGCGGLRKLRAVDPARGMGTRGGARLIYMYVPDARTFFMVDIYGKDEKEDLSAGEKKALAKLAEELKRQAIAAARRRARRET